MTIAEAYSTYGALTTAVSAGEDLYNVARRVYGSDDNIYMQVLMTLNEVVDPNLVAPGTQITYLPKGACSYVSEILH